MIAEGIRDYETRAARYFSMDTAEVREAAVQYRASRPAILAALQQTPGLDERSIRKASAFLESFFADISSNEKVLEMVKECI